MVKVDKASYDFYARLTNYYAQFRAIGVNYNKCVKAVHSIYGEKKALAFLYKLTDETLKLERLIKQTIALTKEFRQWLEQREKEPEADRTDVK